MSHTRRITLLLVSSAATILRCFGTPITANEAESAALAWIRQRDTLGATLSPSIIAIESVPIDAASNVIYVAKLYGGGYVVTAGDDRIEPVLAFSDSGEWVTTNENPLLSFLRRDIEARHAAIGGGVPANRSAKLLTADGRDEQVRAATEKNGRKWQKLLETSATAKGNSPRLLAAGSGLSSISDVRVAPLVKSTWNQSYVIKSGIFSDTKYLCYNYYTPKQYPCGCVATAMAQVMKYHEWPLSYVEPKTFQCKIDGIYTNLTMQGGYYDWDNMLLSPTYSSSVTGRQAIGKLTYDAGVSVGMMYEKSASGAYMRDVAPALRNTFGYASAVSEYWLSFYAIRANLDAGCPVLWGIRGTSGGHAVVVDGYGYSTETFYVHVNMGWGGSSNAWYNPDDGITTNYPYVDDIVLDIFPTESNKVVISGRVLSEAGTPIEGAMVRCRSTDGTFDDYAYTNKKGIWYQFVPKSRDGETCPLQSEVYWNGYWVESAWETQSFNESQDGIDFRIPELANAVDCVSSGASNGLTFSTGASSPWFRQTEHFVSDGGAAQSGVIGHSSESWMEANIYTYSDNGGKLTFWWNVSSEPNCDKLNFSIDGKVVASISGTNSNWKCESFIVTNRQVTTEWGWDTTDYEHVFKWSYSKDKAVVCGLDCGWVDCIKWQNAINVTFSSYDWNHVPSYHFTTNLVMYEDDTYGALPTPERVGYTLSGWFNTTWKWSNEAATSYCETNWLSQASVVTRNQTSWTADWVPNTYFVIFDSNCEDGLMTAQRYIYDVPEMLAKNTFKRDGYEFRGWSLDPSGEIAYRDESEVSNLTAQAYGSVVLYAVWHPATRTSGVPVPYDWLEKYGLVQGGDYELAATRSLGKVAADGLYQPVWHDYLIGTDPTNLNSRLTAMITLTNGTPYITWSPNLNTNSTVRKYTILGKESLTDTADWMQTNSMHRFFKVKVEMP